MFQSIFTETRHPQINYLKKNPKQILLMEAFLLFVTNYLPFCISAIIIIHTWLSNTLDFIRASILDMLSSFFYIFYICLYSSSILLFIISLAFEFLPLKLFNLASSTLCFDYFT